MCLQLFASDFFVIITNVSNKRVDLVFSGSGMHLVDSSRFMLRLADQTNSLEERAYIR